MVAVMKKLVEEVQQSLLPPVRSVLQLLVPHTLVAMLLQEQEIIILLNCEPQLQCW